MKKSILLIAIALATGLFLGWLIFRSPSNDAASEHNPEEEIQSTIWTCSMHPQIRMEKPGKCPICAMDLIQLIKSGSAAIDKDAIQLSKEAAQLASVLTSLVTKQNPVKEIRLYGKVQADERMLQSQVAHVAGRLENLSVNFTGESVVKGEVLAQLYSPELITAQQELLEAAKTKDTQKEIYNAARERLSLLKLTDNQISTIESTGTVMNRIDVISNTKGIVTSRRVNTGDYVIQGSVLFEIADLSKVWVLFEAYQSDLRFIKKGEKVTFTIESYPGDKFNGTVAFIDPVIDPVTRVTKVRVEVLNQSGKLKPEMFATGILQSSLNELNNSIVIPKTAVLWTGKRSVVYVKEPGSTEPVFKMRQIELGPDLGSTYVVAKGLTEGEEIVTSGSFSVDAAAQLEGKPSMMNNPVTDLPGMEMASFRVSGLCEMCKERIEKAALSVKGVSKAEWDMNKKNLDIIFDSNKADLNSVHRAVAESGHDTDLFRADDEVYKALPECCLYRK